MPDKSCNIIVVWDYKLISYVSLGIQPKGNASSWTTSERQRINVSQPNIVETYNIMSEVDRAYYNWIKTSGGHNSLVA